MNGEYASSIGVTAKVTDGTSTSVLAADSAKRYQLFRALITVFGGTTAPATDTIAISVGSTVVARVQISRAANAHAAIPIDLQGFSGALNEAVTVQANSTFGTSGGYVCMVVARKV